MSDWSRPAAGIRQDRVLYARDFGILGDETDESALVQPMMDYARDNKVKTVVFQDPIGSFFSMIDIRVWSGTTVIGAGKWYPYQLRPTYAYIKAAPHTGEKAVFWSEPSGLDPHANEGFARGIRFFNLTLLGRSSGYVSTATKGIWLKQDSIDTHIEDCVISDFSRQCILQERTFKSAGVAHLENVWALGALATDGVLSDWCAAVELRMGENFVDNCSFFAGHKQNYVDANTDLWRTSFLISHNESFVTNSLFQFGDTAAVIGAQLSRISNCRFDNGFGHGVVAEKLGAEVQPRRVQFTNNQIVLNAVTSQHATNTFDGLHLKPSNFVDGWIIKNLLVRSTGKDGKAMKHGYFNGGSVVGTVNPTHTANSCTGFRSEGHATSGYDATNNSQPGPKWDVFGSIETFIDIATPNCEGLDFIRVQSGSSLLITDFLNKHNGDDLYVIKVGGGTVQVADNANIEVGSTLTLSTNVIYHFKKRLSTLYLVSGE